MDVSRSLFLCVFQLFSRIKRWILPINPRYDRIREICESSGSVEELKESQIELHVNLSTLVFNGGNRPGYTPLTLACRCGHLPLVIYLIEDEHVDFTVCDKYWKASALHHACKNNHSNIVQYLLENCPLDVNILTDDNNHYTCLHWTAARGHISSSVVLLEHGANINARDKTYSTPLHWAAFHGQNTMITFLMTHGADEWSLNMHGKLPIELAETRGFLTDTLKQHIFKLSYEYISRKHANHSSSSNSHNKNTMISSITDIDHTTASTMCTRNKISERSRLPTSNTVYTKLLPHPVGDDSDHDLYEIEDPPGSEHEVTGEWHLFPPISTTTYSTPSPNSSSSAIPSSSYSYTSLASKPSYFYPHKKDMSTYKLLHTTIDENLDYEEDNSEIKEVGSDNQEIDSSKMNIHMNNKQDDDSHNEEDMYTKSIPPVHYEESKYESMHVAGGHNMLYTHISKRPKATKLTDMVETKYPISTLFTPAQNPLFYQPMSKKHLQQHQLGSTLQSAASLPSKRDMIYEEVEDRSGYPPYNSDEQYNYCNDNQDWVINHHPPISITEKNTIEYKQQNTLHKESIETIVLNKVNDGHNNNNNNNNNHSSSSSIRDMNSSGYNHMMIEDNDNNNNNNNDDNNGDDDDDILSNDNTWTST